MTWSGRGTVLMVDRYTFMLVTVPVLNKTVSHKPLVLDESTDDNTVLPATIPLILAPPTPEGSGTATKFARAADKRDRAHNRGERACWTRSFRESAWGVGQTVSQKMKLKVPYLYH